MRPILNKHTDFNEFTADLSRAIDRPAYVLCGDEKYLIQQIRNKLIHELVTPAAKSLDEVSIVGDGNTRSVDWNRVISEIATPPFLSIKKVITLTNTGLFSSALGASREAEEIEEALTNIPESCCLIFSEETVIYNSRVLKRMREAGAMSGKFDKQTLSDLTRWVSGLCSREDIRITKEAAESLIMRCESSMTDILNELSTVFLYYQFTGKKDIHLANIDYLCREDMTGKIFDLTDAIAEKRMDDALRMIDIFHARREAPLYILTMLARQSRDLMIAKESGRVESVIASGLTTSKFYARKLTNQARRFSMSKIESMLEGCFQADLAIKSGRLDDDDAVTIVVIRACEAS